VFKVLIDSLKVVDTQIAGLDAEIARRSREDPIARRLMTIPGIGPITATAITALAPPPETFRRAGTLPPGWGSRPYRSRLVASRGSAPSRRWANEP
jgi:transposase